VMTAALGLEFHAETGAWLRERVQRKKPRQEELIVPGDLPEILLRMAVRPGYLETALRLAGNGMTAAALSGCPRESLHLVKKGLGSIGGAVFEDSVVLYRARLSTDEIADAQAAFAEFLREVEAEAEAESYTTLAPAEPVTDPSLMRDLSSLILEMDGKLLKAVATGMDNRSLAEVMQGMDPAAHDRILVALGTRRESKVLDTLGGSEPLGGFEILRAAQAFCQAVLASVSPKSRGGPDRKPATLPLPARVRSLLSAILGRE
jgi:hypothetical protein